MPTMDFLDRCKDFGLLMLRAGIGAMFMYHGYGILFAGPLAWKQMGGSMAYIGITAAPKVFGLIAVLSEFIGGFLLILGLFFRPACTVMFFTMMVAAIMHLSRGDGLQTASHAIELGIVFFSLIFIGEGKYALDEYLKKFVVKGR